MNSVKLSGFLQICAVIYGIVGVGLFVIPTEFLSPFGAALNAGGVWISRIVGAALIGFAITFWLGRDAPPSPLRRGLLAGNLAYHVLDLLTNSLAVASGVLNAVGAIFVMLHLLLGLGFGYFFWFGSEKDSMDRARPGQARP